MNTKITCFKYRDPARTLQTLAEGTLFFASPASLNDTLEAKYDHASPEDFVKVMTQTCSHISQQRGGPPLEFDLKAMQEMAEANNRENQRLEDFTKNIGIFSAAQRPNDQAMWAYYAKDSAGACLELEWDQATLQANQILPCEVIYQDKARIHNRAEDWKLNFLDIARRYPQASLEKLYQLSLEEDERRKWGLFTASRAASIKHTDWAHEKEIRFFAPKSGAVPILKSVLKKVHFINTKAEEWHEIFPLLAQHYPGVELTKWKFTHGQIHAIPQEFEIKLSPI